MDKFRVFVKEDIRQRLRQLEVVHQRMQGQAFDGRIPVIFQDGLDGAPLKVLQPLDLLKLKLVDGTNADGMGAVGADIAAPSGSSPHR